MKEIGRTVFLGVLLALPVIYFLDNNPDVPLNMGEISFILFLSIGSVQLLAGIFKKKGE